MAWEVKTIKSGERFDARSMLSLLAENKIAAVRVSNFFPKDELIRVVKKINNHGVLWYPKSENKQGRIGLSATEYCAKLNGKALYFEKTPEALHVRDGFFSDTSHPIEKIIALFFRDYAISVAREPSLGGAPYFSGLIRAMGAKSTLHFDLASHQLRGWSISESTEQFGLVLYLQMPVGGGGELLIYNRPWVPEDDMYNEDKIQKGPYGFNPVFLKNEHPTKIVPVAGDLIIFRTRNFHQIDQIDPTTDQYRLTFNSFLSLKNEELFLWS